MHPFYRLSKFIDRAIHYFEVSFLTVALVVMTCALFWQAGCEFFEISVPWAGELARYLMVWVTCVGASAATRNRQHIAIQALVNLLRGRARRAAEAAVALICVALCSVACVVGAQYALDAHDIGRTTLVLKIPLWMIYTALPLTAAFVGLRFALTLVAPADSEPEAGERGGA